MKFTAKQIDITPREPLFLGGYIERKAPFTKVHDPITATVFVLTVEGEKVVWISVDLIGGSFNVIEAINAHLKDKGLNIPKEHFVLGGTHTHSGPNTSNHLREDVNIFRPEEQDYVNEISCKIAEAVFEAYYEEGVNVHTRYSDVLIDGLYSNRNDKNKLSDKHEYMIGFFNEEDQLAGVYHLMSHHCTVVGSKSTECSADLYGALRKRLQQQFGCPFLMAQGNAGDMGNRQYRDGNDFAALERQADNIFTQIMNKYCWKDIDMNGYDYKSINYHASYHVDYSGYQKKYEEFSARLAMETDVDMIKHLTGWVANAKRKKDLPPEDVEVDMPSEIICMNDLEIVLVPGELGSILGLRIKEASGAKLCFVWGYVNGCHLGYMVEKEAYTTESQESQVTAYNAGIPDEYVATIIRNL